MQKDHVQEHYQSDKKPFSIIRKLGLSDTILGYRTPFDKSPYPAIENILRGAIKAFITSFGVKASLSLILSLIKYKQWIRNPKILLQALVNKDNAMMGCFIGSFTFILKLMIFLCRIIRKKDDGFNGFIAGFSAGYFSLFFTNQSGRVFLACLVLARAFDTYYNHLVNTGKIKKSKYHYVWIFAALNSITGYCYAHEDYLLSPAFIKFGDTVTCQSRNDLIMTRLYHEMTRRNLTGRGIIHDLIF